MLRVAHSIFRAQFVRKDITSVLTWIIFFCVSVMKMNGFSRASMDVEVDKTEIPAVNRPLLLWLCSFCFLFYDTSKKPWRNLPKSTNNYQ